MGKKILLADDSITIQKVIELTFSDEDFDVVTVGNGRLALERLADVRPDIVLCDIIMPEKDGYEVCEQIKSSPSWSHLPVLLLTGAFEPFDQERATRAGYDGSLAKPFEPETLIAKVKELLARAPRPATGRPAAPEPQPNAPAPSFVPPPAHLGTASEPDGVASSEPLPEPPGGAFIPDEPFAPISSFASDPAAATIPSVPRQPLAAISAEESADLAAPFAEAAEDTVSTVMFRASELPWSATPVPAAAPPAEPPAEVPREPLLVPDAPAAAPQPGAGDEELVEEPPVFEAVLDEDLEFGEAYPPEAEPQTVEESEPLAHSPGLTEAEEDIFAPELTARAPRGEEGATGAFAALVGDAPAPAEGATDTHSYAPLGAPQAEPIAPAPVEAARDVAPTAAAAPLAPREAEPAPEPTPEPEVLETLEEEVGPGDLESEPLVAAADGAPESAGIEGLAETTAEAVESSLPEAAEVAGTGDLQLEPASDPAVAADAPRTEAAAEAGRAKAEAELPPEPELETAPEIEPAPEIEEAFAEEAPFEVTWPEEPLAAQDAVAALASPPGEPAAEPAVEAAASAATLAPLAPQRHAAEESFGDLAEAVADGAPLPVSSEAAAVAVPVDMVEKIAQRVVAQISEKAVREIAWEVIPDLAEALIRQEIEKLKAELAKL